MAGKRRYPVDSINATVDIHGAKDILTKEKHGEVMTTRKTGGLLFETYTFQTY